MLKNRDKIEKENSVDPNETAVSAGSTRVVQKVLSLIGFLGFIPGIF